MSILSTDTDILGALYRDLKTAEKVAQRLRVAGVEEQELSVLSHSSQFPDANFPEVDQSMLDHSRSTVEEATEVGAVVGGTGGFVAGLTSIVVPGAGPLLVLGTMLVSAIAGMSVGALTGGAVGILIELGFTEQEAKRLASRLDRNEALVLARADSQHPDTIRGIMNAHRPTEIMEKELIWKR